MFSVTRRVQSISQPKYGFLPISCFVEEFHQYDTYKLEDINPSVKSLQGLCVDYLTRFLLGFPKEQAFSISIKGSQIINEYELACTLLDQINGLDDTSIISATLLVCYDAVYRDNPRSYATISKDLITPELISNIRILVNRSVQFFRSHGPIIQTGFTFNEGYNGIVSSGDGDFLSKDTIWDLKTSSQKIGKDQTLQILIYYVLSQHSKASIFKHVNRIGIYDPTTNKSYHIHIEKVPNSLLQCVCQNIIGYITPAEDSRWRESYGTNAEYKEKIFYNSTINAIRKTKFNPDWVSDGIYDIPPNEYWGYINKTYCEIRPYSRTLPSSRIKFLKRNGYFMFISYSNFGELYLLNGAQKYRLDYELNYYYDNLDKYAEAVLKAISPYWNVLNYLSNRLVLLENNSNKYLPSKSNSHVSSTNNQLTQYSFINRNRLGKIHGCIVDIDFFNHLFVNPFNGEVTPYFARTPFDRKTYPNLLTLLQENKPELIGNGVDSLLDGLSLDFNNKDVSKLSSTSLPTADSSDHQPFTIENNELLPNDLDTKSLYSISRKMKALQSIVDFNIVSLWIDTFLPPIDTCKYKIDSDSLLGTTSIMNNGIKATVINDRGYRDISVQFEDGQIVEHISRTKFKNKSIPHPLHPQKTNKTSPKTNAQLKNRKLASYVGETKKMKCGYFATVIEDFGCNDITIKFEDGLVRKHCRRDKFRDGIIAHKESN